MSISRLFILASLLALLAVGACARKAVPPGVIPAPQPYATPAPRGFPESGGIASEKGADTVLPSPDRMIVRQGSLNLVVADLAKALEGAARIAQEREGYVVSSSQQGEEGASITLRVPVGRFDDALKALKALAVRVLGEQTTSQDVTEEYVDLQASLRNWEAAEAQYLELIKRAQKVEEVLQVQRELTNVRGQIERIKGRMQYLERTSALASIDVHFQPAKSPVPVVRPGWSPGETLRGALRSLAALAQNLAGAAIWALIYSPVWLALGLVAFFLWRRLTR